MVPETSISLPPANQFILDIKGQVMPEVQNWGGTALAVVLAVLLVKAFR